MVSEIQPHAKESSFKYLSHMTLGALGVVYGDIGTSPLYAIRECFHGKHGIALTLENIFGILSLITWSLILVISFKYVLYVMRADNRGEGGILALMALAQKKIKKRSPLSNYIVVLMGLFGAALLYGDGMITPAISVLSAVEGLVIAAPFFESYLIPITIGILCLLFFPQSRGTGRIGLIFGPIIFIWFVVLSVLGILNILPTPEVLLAANPWYAFDFFLNHRSEALIALGAVFLVVTGGEALYADMGHFGKFPIQIGWFLIVLPALLLNYYGQGALLIRDPSAITNPFYIMAPKWALYPLVGIATLAAIIASQALITGAFSLTRQAVQLGYLPRTNIRHTSTQEIGQIYSPFVNWALLFSTIFLVLFFHTSTNLAAAYGIAVTLTMLITTILIFFVAHYSWKWSRLKSLTITCILIVIDFAFLSANIVKIADGGWFPLVIGFGILTIMTTWGKGRQLLWDGLRKKSVRIHDYLTSIAQVQLTRVPGTAIFMNGNIGTTPPSFIHNVIHNKMLHEHIIFLTVATAEIPYVNAEDRTEITSLGLGFYQLIVRFGFMEDPDVYSVIRFLQANSDLPIDLRDTTFILGRETVIATKKPGMALWRERLFAFLSRNAQSATTYFHIPAKKVIEIGMQIEL